MNLGPALFAPLALQAIAMAFDELHFHRKRGLGRWERMGHPFDTLTMLACLGWVLAVGPSRPHVACYVVLAVVSCLVITKDEFVHARVCSPGEHWIHALLFVLHPLALASIGLLWPALWGRAGELPDWLRDVAPIARLLPAEFALTASFCVYQALYWNVLWIRRATAAR